jgi:hypothetical protein
MLAVVVGLVVTVGLAVLVKQVAELLSPRLLTVVEPSEELGQRVLLVRVVV